MKQIESFKHLLAKKLLCIWLQKHYETRMEVKFFSHTMLMFVADIVCYDNGIPFAIYEVVHTHGIDFKKLSRIQQWSYRNAIQLQVYEVSAEWILRQVKRPKTLKYIDFTTII